MDRGRPTERPHLPRPRIPKQIPLLLVKKKEKVLEMTRDELNKMSKRELIEHSSQYGVHPNRKDIPKRMLIDLIMHHRFNRPPPKRENKGEGELNQLD